eukprot:Sspe_Gene.5725::Locus_1904_Transcript_2_2_Confidence_0.800_Length_5246::g.5725::m.5725
MQAPQLPRIRRSIYALIAAFLQHQPEMFDAHRRPLAIIMQGAFSEKSCDVHTSMWPAVLLWMKVQPTALEEEVSNVHGTVFSRLFALLRRTSGVAGSHVTYPSLLPFLSLLRPSCYAGDDPSGKKAHHFVDAFLINLLKGLRSDGLALPGVPHLLDAWMECWWFLLVRASKFAPEAAEAIEESLVTFHLEHMLRYYFASNLRIADPSQKLAIPLTRLALGPEKYHEAAIAAWIAVLRRNDATLEAPAAPHKTEKKKKGGGEEVLAYDAVDLPDAKGMLGKLHPLLAALPPPTEASSPFFAKLTAVTGALLSELLTGPSAPALADDIAKCWEQLNWSLDPASCKKEYDAVLSAELIKGLEGKSDLPLAAVVRMAKPVLQEGSEYAAVLGKALESSSGATVLTLLAAYPGHDVEGMAAPSAALAKLALERCSGDPEWAEVLVQLLPRVAKEVVADVGSTLLNMLRGLPTQTTPGVAKEGFNTIRVATSVIEIEVLETEATEDLLSELLPAIARSVCGSPSSLLHPRYHKATSDHPVDVEGAIALVQAAVGAAKKAFGGVGKTLLFPSSSLEDSEGFTPLPVVCEMAALTNPPCASLIGLVDTLWEDARGAVAVQETSDGWKLAHMTGHAELGFLDLDTSKAVALARWARAVAVLPAGAESMLHLARAAALGTAGVIAKAAVPPPPDMTTPHPDTAIAILRTLPSDSLDFLAATCLMKWLLAHREGKKLMVQAAIPPESCIYKEAALQAVCKMSEGDAVEKDEEFLRPVHEYVNSVAVKDEIGEDVADAAVLSALQLCFCPLTKSNEELPALSVAAWQKLQDPPPVEPWGLNQRLSLAALLLRAAVSEGVVVPIPIDQISETVAEGLRQYAPTNPFAWMSGGTLKFPTSPPIALEPLAEVVGLLLRTDGISDETRSLGLAVAIDVLSSVIGGLSAEWLATEGMGALALCTTIISNEAHKKLINPQWGTTFHRLYLSLARGLLGVSMPDRLQLASDLTEEDSGEEEAGADLPGAAEVLMGLCAYLSRIDVAEDERTGSVTELDDIRLPAAVREHVEVLVEFNRGVVRDVLTGGDKVTMRTAKQVWQVVTMDTVLPWTHGMLVGWSILFDWLCCEQENITARQKAKDESTAGEMHSLVIQRLKSLDIFPGLMSIIAALLCTPRLAVLSRLGGQVGAAPMAATGIANTLMGMTRGLPPIEEIRKFISHVRTPGDAGLAAVHLLSQILSCIPTVPRRWLSECDQGVRQAVTNFVEAHLSPSLIRSELQFVIDMGGGVGFSLDDATSVKVVMGARSVLLSYDYQDAVITLRLVLPPAFPLVPVQQPTIDAELRKTTAAIKGDVWRKWLLQMTVSLLNKSATLWDCVVLWWKNLHRHFEGQQECPICYQVVDTATQQLPTMPCKQCSGKFHKLCMLKWFKKSNNSTCPLCRAPWYSGAKVS